MVYSDVSRWFLDCLRCDLVVVIWLRCGTFMFRVDAGVVFGFWMLLVVWFGCLGLVYKVWSGLCVLGFASCGVFWVGCEWLAGLFV